MPESQFNQNVSPDNVRRQMSEINQVFDCNLKTERSEFVMEPKFQSSAPNNVQNVVPNQVPRSTLVRMEQQKPKQAGSSMFQSPMAQIGNPNQPVSRPVMQQVRSSNSTSNLIGVPLIDRSKPQIEPQPVVNEEELKAKKEEMKALKKGNETTDP